jgi:cell division protein FtsZ
VRLTVIATGFTGEIQQTPAQSASVNPRAGIPPQQRRPMPMQQPPFNPPGQQQQQQQQPPEPKEKPGLDIPDFLRKRNKNNPQS